MPDVKLPQFPAGIQVSGEDMAPVVQNGTTGIVKVKDIRNIGSTIEEGGTEKTASNENLKTVNQKVATLSQSVDNSFQTVNQNFTNVGNQIQSTNNAINTTNENIDNHEKDTDVHVTPEKTAKWDGYAASLSEKMNNWLKGKKINFISDSMGAIGTKTLPTLISEKLNCTVNSYAISGNTISGTGGIAERSINMDTASDVNIIFGGTNDWTWNKTLGSESDTTTATVYGALKVLCENLIATYPNAINMFITPLKRSKLADAGVTNYLIEDVVKAICDVCSKYNVLVLDMYNNAPNFNPNISTLNSRYTSGDGLHPNDAYLSILTNVISNNLLTYNSYNTIYDRKTNYDLTPLNNFTAITGFKHCIDKVGNLISFNADLNVNALSGGDAIIIFTLPFKVKRAFLHCFGNNGEKYEIEAKNNGVIWYGSYNNSHITNLTYISISGVAIMD